MPSTLTATPSLEQLKNQAKDLLRAFRSGDPDAVCRVEECLRATTSPLMLAGAQHVVAREYGFASWPKLKAHMLEAVGRQAYLREQAERLGVRDWRVLLAADAVLAEAGQAGIEAALWGMSHPHPRARRGCAGFMDHRADDSCIAALRQLALHDPVPAVRRTAVHSAYCLRCKPAPLTCD